MAEAGVHIIVALATKHLVVAIAAVERIDTVVTADEIVSAAAANEVIALATGELVITVAAEDFVLAIAAVDRVVTSAAIEAVVSAFAVEAIIAGLATDGVVTISGLDRIVSCSRLDLFAALTAAIRVIAAVQLCGREAVGEARERNVKAPDDEQNVTALVGDPDVGHVAGRFAESVERQTAAERSDHEVRAATPADFAGLGRKVSRRIEGRHDDGALGGMSEDEARHDALSDLCLSPEGGRHTTWQRAEFKDRAGP